MDDGYFEKFGNLIKDCIHKDQVELEKVRFTFSLSNFFFLLAGYY